MIDTHVDKDLNLTTFICTGTPTPDEVEDRLHSFYAATPTLHTIWDYTTADLSALTADSIHDLAGYLKSVAHSRAGGRAALVFTMAQLMQINDRLPSMAELTIEQGTIKIFDSLEKARHWIAT